jgi:hypothetical protein
MGPVNFLDQQFVASLSVNSEPAYGFWEGIITSRRDTVSQENRSALTTKALDLASTPSALNQRKPSLLKLAIELCPESASEQSTLARRILELLWHTDNIIRNAAAAVIPIFPILRTRANQGDIRIHLNAGIHEHLRSIVLSNYQSFQPVVDVLIATKDLWNEGSARSITQLALTLSSDENLKLPALALLESINKFDDTDLPDVLHILRALEAAQGTTAERARNLLKRIAPEAANGAREEIPPRE